MFDRFRLFLLLLLGALLLASSLAGGVTEVRARDAQDESRAFMQTGYTITNDAIWNYFQSRGGLDTFGYPVSRTFQLQGFPVQLFQRNVIQVVGDQARPLNLLDPNLLPVTQVGGLTMPAYDEQLAEEAPTPDKADYGTLVQEFLETNVPNSWEGQEVNFLDHFYGAAPQDVPANSTLLALEVWGFPTSEPMRDPNNDNFIYQRFQRGIMHYDATAEVTRGILLGNLFKNVLLGQNLPAATRAELANSPLLELYAPGQENWMAHTVPNIAPPVTWENTDLTEAFEPEESTGEAPTQEIVVYRSCEASPQGALTPLPHEVDAQLDPAEAAIRELLRGVSAEEQEQGCQSYFSAETERSLLSVQRNEEGDTLTIDFANFSSAIPDEPGAKSFLPPGVMAELTWTIFQQFPEVQAVRFAFDGSERDFWTWVAGSPTEPQPFTRDDWEAL